MGTNGCFDRADQEEGHDRTSYDFGQEFGSTPTLKATTRHFSSLCLSLSLFDPIPLIPFTNAQTGQAECGMTVHSCFHVHDSLLNVL